ncbi:MAG: MBOAT family protein [Clostridia bacterium]|nr:MBOAT family protein [Clostridia bacterium]
MVFSSLTFLLLFLPLTLLCYYLARGVKARNLVLCLFSLVFYAWGEPVYVLLMLGSILFNYCIGLALGKTAGKGVRRALLVLALAVNLGAIGLFKYGNFVLENLGLLFGPGLPRLSLALPLGISFYTFQILSYVLDVYHEKTPVQSSLLRLATYIVLFPQLVAGPIVRYEEIQSQLQSRRETLEDFTEGLRRFAIGLGKKVILANAMAAIADPILDSAVLPPGSAWLAAVAYMLQIYFDFSGYSDMAIGMGRFFGFRFSENFNYPYAADSITEFWRRWHISLSSWFRDYVYFPLGGSRCSTARNILNLMIVWTLTGLWHGASWNFVLWGLYYGVLLILEKYVLAGLIRRLPKVLRRVLTLLAVLAGWVIFRQTSLPAIGECLRAMLNPTAGGLGSYLAANAGVLENTIWLIPAVIGCFPLGKYLTRRFSGRKGFGLLRSGWALLVWLLSLSLLLGATYNPFIYFRF